MTGSTFLDPLPCTVRLRLRYERVLDTAGIWLVGKGHHRLAVALWRVTGLWR